MKTSRNSFQKINVVTLGCSKNLVDSETLARQIELNDIEIVYDSDLLDARTVIINTCGFIKDSKEESINTILNFTRAKEQGLIDRVFVMGCLSERYKLILQNEIGEVDQFFGVNSIADVIRKLGLKYRKELLGERHISTPGHYAYLKVSEGCDRICAFCAIPIIRGSHKSRSIDELVTEACFLASRGVKELILIAQDLTYYGRDQNNRSQLANLLYSLISVKGIEWIRLHYAYPATFPVEVIGFMKNEPKVCRYLDIPFQHISDSMLRKMRRSISSKETIKLLERLRAEIPGIALRTTLLVGHPGETEKDFNELLEFVSWARFDRLGVFIYSHEEGTYAWKNYQDDVPQKTKEQRAERVMNLQKTISKELNYRKIGNLYKVIIDRREGANFIGRTEHDSPEVDNEVYISSNKKKLKPGMFATVRITAGSEYDLTAELTDI